MHQADSLVLDGTVQVNANVPAPLRIVWGDWDMQCAPSPYHKVDSLVNMTMRSSDFSVTTMRKDLMAPTYSSL